MCLCRQQEEGAARERRLGGGPGLGGEQEDHGPVSAQRTVPEQQGGSEETHSGAAAPDR